MTTTRSARFHITLPVFLLLPGLGCAAISSSTEFLAAARVLACFRVVDEAPPVALNDVKGNPCDAASANGSALAAKKTVILAAAEEEGVTEDQQAEEREHAKRLRRAREEHEARRAEAARKLEAEQTRQREINRLRATVSNLEQRESFLSHEVLWSQRELDSMSRDPADHSAMARRGGIERQLFYLQNQLNQTTTTKQGAVRQLHQLQFR